MNSGLDRVKLIAMALIAVAFVGLLTPVCTMPACEKTTSTSCSDFQSACAECPGGLVMKHVSDEGVAALAPALSEPTIVAGVDAVPALILCSADLRVPDATASPPPLDPLGVRITV